MHTVAPTPEKLPASHRTHVSRPDKDAYEPAGQRVQAVLSFWPNKRLLVPAGQSVHAFCEVAPRFGLKEPVGHGVKTSASELAEALGQ